MPERNLPLYPFTYRALWYSSQVRAYLLILGIRKFDTQGIETVPWILRIDTVANPLRNNLLFSLINWASRMLCKASIHRFCFGVDVTKENGISSNRLDVNSRVTKVRGTSFRRQSTVHDHGGHASSRLVRKTGTVTITMLVFSKIAVVRE